jgi:hypothetical protein
MHYYEKTISPLIRRVRDAVERLPTYIIGAAGFTIGLTMLLVGWGFAGIVITTATLIHLMLEERDC